MLDSSYNRLKTIDMFLLNIIELSKKIDKEETCKAVKSVVELKNLLYTLQTSIGK